jgi:hypothetical protein
LRLAAPVELPVELELRLVDVDVLVLVARVLVELVVVILAEGALAYKDELTPGVQDEDAGIRGS